MVTQKRRLEINKLGEGGRVPGRIKPVGVCFETRIRSCKMPNWSKQRNRPGNVVLSVVPVAMRVGGILVRSIDLRRVHRLPRGRPDALGEIRRQGTPVGKSEYRVHHVQRQPRLLQVREAEIPGKVLRVDYVSDAKC